MLYSRRKAQQEMQRKQERGELLWTDAVPSNVRQKITWLVEEAGETLYMHDHNRGGDEVFASAHYLLTRDLGMESLAGLAHESQDMRVHLKSAPNREMPNVLEALSRAVKLHAEEKGGQSAGVHQEFVSAVNELLGEYCVSYTLEDIAVVDFESKILHLEVVKPTLVLASNPEWQSVETAYQGALKEIEVDPSDAITDAATALQEGLRLLGCEGEDFSALMKSATKPGGILSGYDARYCEAIQRLVGWVSGHRANKGDSHKVVHPTSDDAWLAVHVVGALLVHLSRKANSVQA